MRHKYLSVAATPSVKAAQEFYGSRKTYARLDEGDEGSGYHHDRIGPREAAFISSRDFFYLATVSETGWPYVQYKGGPRGFLHIIDEKTLAYADFRGNRQYISTGNIGKNDRVSLFLMDYATQARLKIFAKAEIKEAGDAPDLAELLRAEGYPAVIERVVLIHLEAFDWNCQKHIKQRFSQEELAEVLEPVTAKLAALEAENTSLRARVAQMQSNSP